MAQLQTLFRWIAKYHFWLLCGVVVAVALACWYQAASAYRADFEQNSREINSEFTNLSNLQTAAFHPNDNVIQAQQAEVREQARAVLDIWQSMYNVQSEKVLKWPEELPPDFIRTIQRLKWGETIPESLRSHYGSYARLDFPNLGKIIDANKIDPDALSQAGTSPMAAYRTNPAFQAQSEDYLVLWEDQQSIGQELYFLQSPTPLEIWVTQENLWVYEALLHAIRNTNAAKGSSRHETAAVQIIHSMRVGQPAADTSRGKGRIQMSQFVGIGGNQSGGSGGREALRSGVDPSSMSAEEFMELTGGGGGGSGGPAQPDQRRRGTNVGGGLPPEQQERVNLLSERYIDRDGQPIEISADEAANPIQYDTKFGVESKRLPVRLSLHMDQRWVNRLIAELANAPLQVEVDEVRVGVNDSSGGSGRTSNTRLRGLTGQANGFDRQPQMKSVIIQGVVSIINKPNRDVLPIEE